MALWQSSYTSSEMGFAPVPPPPPGDLPPGQGGLTTPHFLTFDALIQTVSHAYPYQFDEALRASPANALAMRRDAVLWGAMQARMRPTAQLAWHVEPRDETDPAEAEAAKLVTEIVEDIPRFQMLRFQLLKALWYGRYAVEVGYEWATWRGRQVLKVRDFIPINGDKLRFRWDGTPGVLVYPNFPGTREATDWGMCHFLTPTERQQYVIHQHEPDDADWTEPMMAGSVHGTGIRGQLYWFWWLKQQVFGLLMNYLQRYANGLTVVTFDAHNPQAEAWARGVVQQPFQNIAIAIPRWNSTTPDLNTVTRLEVGTASAELLWRLATEYFDRVQTQMILGQTLSSGTGATGLGSGVANLHADTLSEIVKYDSINLEQTLQTDLIDVLYRYNAPGVRPGRFSLQAESPDSDAIMGYAGQLYQMGVPLDEDEMYEIAQLSKPKPGSGIVSQIGGMQPAAVGGAPQGVPISGQAGPTGSAQPMPAGNGAPMAFTRAAGAKRRLTHLPRKVVAW